MLDAVTALDKSKAQQSLQFLADTNPGGEVDATLGEPTLGERPLEASTEQLQQHLAARILDEDVRVATSHPNTVDRPVEVPTKSIVTLDKDSKAIRTTSERKPRVLEVSVAAKKIDTENKQKKTKKKKKKEKKEKEET